MKYRTHCIVSSDLHYLAKSDFVSWFTVCWRSIMPAPCCDTLLRKQTQNRSCCAFLLLFCWHNERVKYVTWACMIQETECWPNHKMDFIDVKKSQVWLLLAYYSVPAHPLGLALQVAPAPHCASVISHKILFLLLMLTMLACTMIWIKRSLNYTSKVKYKASRWWYRRITFSKRRNMQSITRCPRYITMQVTCGRMAMH